MKANEFHEIANQGAILSGYVFNLTVEQAKNIYNSLKELEELKAKQNPQPRYVLGKNIERLGVTAGHPVILAGDTFIVEHDSDSTIIGLKETIKDGLIKEVKPREVYIRVLNDGSLRKEWTAGNWVVPTCTYIKFVEVLNG